MAHVVRQASGLQVERIALAEPLLPFSSLARRAAHALQRTIERATVAGAVRAAESGDPERLARYMARGRAWHAKLSMPSSSQMVEALSDVSLSAADGLRVNATWLRHGACDDGATLIYVHGGSFIAERSPRLTALIARIAKTARVKTIMVDYRLAPEHPCPAAIDDVESAALDLIAQGQDAARIGIVAESAGASIALAAVHRLRDAGHRLGAVCFLSPWTDLALTGRSAAARAVTGDSGTSIESMAICAHFYLQGRSPLDPVASPVYGDLRGLPPLLIHTSRTDGLHDDACMLAERAHDAGSEVTLRIWSSGSHVFERLFDGQSERAIADAGAFLRQRLSGGKRTGVS
jgi:epsilon-lactone hydrolase